MAESTPRLFIPALGRLYGVLGVLTETLLRVTAGGLLVVHGLPKITNPYGAASMVERLGFFPGTLWSLLLSVTEFFGGALLLLGLFTRPAALATSVVLAVTVYFHWVVLGQGFKGAEFSILWTAVLWFFVARGANCVSVDARMGRQF